MKMNSKFAFIFLRFFIFTVVRLVNALQLFFAVQRLRRSNGMTDRALVILGYGGSGSEVGDSCYASRKINAVGLGSRLLFFASTTRNSISLRSRLANDSAISLATS